MKAILNLSCAASLACMLTFAASRWLPESPVTATRVVPHAENFGTMSFTSHARSKVVQYFDTYRTDPLGLPAVCAVKVKMVELPAAWVRHDLAKGWVFSEAERSALIEAPAELVRVLPASAQSVRYFLAGDHLVAVNDRFKVLDSVRIPTVHVQDGQTAPLELARNVGVRF